MNKVILIGNLGCDPEIRYTTSENSLAVSRFSIAVNRKIKTESGTDVDFFNCVAFGKTAENIGKFFTKGRKIAISGRLQTSSWTDNEGHKKSAIDIIVEEFDFCDKKSETTPANNQTTVNQNSFNGMNYDVEVVEDSDSLPF